MKKTRSFADDEYFYYQYENAQFSIQRKDEKTYIFEASIGFDAHLRPDSRPPLICSRDVLIKAIKLAKQKGFEALKDQIEFDPYWQEWYIGMPYPYLSLSYSLDSENYTLKCNDDLFAAKITVFSSAFPKVMELLHELALLYQESSRTFPVDTASSYIDTRKTN